VADAVPAPESVAVEFATEPADDERTHQTVYRTWPAAAQHCCLVLELDCLYNNTLFWLH